MQAGGAGALPVLTASMAAFRSCSHLAFSSQVLRTGLGLSRWAGPHPAVGQGVGVPALPRHPVLQALRAGRAAGGPA